MRLQKNILEQNRDVTTTTWRLLFLRSFNNPEEYVDIKIKYSYLAKMGHFEATSEYRLVINQDDGGVIRRNDN